MKNILTDKLSKIFITAILILSVILAFIYLNSYEGSTYGEYGVYLGITGKDIQKLEGYRTIVIEPSEFNKEQISELHKNGQVVYGYINIGSLEEYRPYYSEYKDITIGEYENWEDEKWVDTSSAGWQEFIVKKLGTEYANLGIDGFFVDNCDVYYNYQREDIYKGLCYMLRGLMECSDTVIINGGDLFVSRCISEGVYRNFFTGINQECVFTSIDFKNRSYGAQDSEVTGYYKEYLNRVKYSGLSVYITEYHANKSLSKRINKYCEDNGFYWYNAKGLELN